MRKCFPLSQWIARVDCSVTKTMFRVLLALLVIAACAVPARVGRRVGGYLSETPGQALSQYQLPKCSSPHSLWSEVPCFLAPQQGPGVHVSRHSAPVHDHGRSDFFLFPVVGLMLSCLTVSVMVTAYCAGQLLTASFISLLPRCRNNRNNSG